VSYEQDLAFALRMRGLTDAEIAKALGEAATYSVEARSSLQDLFGSPVEYASQFPKRKRASLGRKVITTTTVIALVYVVFALVAHPLWGLDVAAAVGGFRVWPALVLIVVGGLGGFLLDYRLPVKPLPAE